MQRSAASASPRSPRRGRSSARCSRARSPRAARPTSRSRRCRARPPSCSRLFSSVVAGAGAAVAAAWAAPAPAPVVPAFARAFRIPLRLPRADGIALTFDDGPHPQGTPAVIETLARFGATATVFLVGEQGERFPSLAAEIAAAGHEVALHGHRHVLTLRRTPAGLARDLDLAAWTIANAARRAPTHYRPPYGGFS